MKPKFRQWLGERFRYWGYVNDDLISFTSPVDQDIESEQFTGIKDINGVDVYVGDKLRISEDLFTGEVIYDDAALCFSVRVFYRDRYSETMTLTRFIWSRRRAMKTTRAEVIGNIHETETD